MLRGVSGCDLMLDALLLEEFLSLASNIFTPSIRAEGSNMEAHLDFSPGNKRIEVMGNLVLFMESSDKDFV